MRVRIIGLALCLLGTASCASMGEGVQQLLSEQYAELSVNHFIENMSIKDDALETEVVFTTRAGSNPAAITDPYLSMFSNQNDEFMRAYYFKESKKTVYQIYFTLRASDWRRPYKINFGEQLGSMPIERIGVDVNCSSGACTNYEDAIVTLSPEDIDKMIKHLEGNNLSLLQFRVKTQSSQDYNSAISLNELKAIRQQVADYLS